MLGVPLESLHEGLADDEEEEAAHAAIHDLTAEVVDFFVLASTDGGGEEEYSSTAGPVGAASPSKASNGSSTIGMVQPPSGAPTPP